MERWRFSFCAALVILTGLPLCSQGFEDISEQAGIDFLYREVAGLGGGVAFVDYDNDGDEDLFITGGEEAGRFYRNEGAGTYSDQTNTAGLHITNLYYTTGVVAGDLDNDGYRDLFVTTWYGESLQDFEARNLLFHNNGDGTFTEMGQFAGILEGAISMGSTLLDIDQDGYLDIYVTNYVEESGFLYNEIGQVIGFDHTCYPNFFYHNNGDGTFTERAQELGIDDSGCGFAAVGTDYNQDGQIDLYVANDFGEWLPNNALFENEGNTAFLDVSIPSGADLGLYGMGIAQGDYDHDQDLDIYVTNIGRNVLLKNNGDGTYSDQTTLAGVENIFSVDTALATGWGTLFMDYDHDTYEDLFVANGLIPTASFIPTSIIDPNKAYHNNGDGSFADLSDSLGFNDSDRGRGLAYSDIDLDGDLDLCLIIIEGSGDLEAKVRLYRNNTENDHNWLQVKLTGTTSNRDAIGSTVWLYADDLVLMREISGGSSHCSHSSIIAHFGLGEHETVDSLRIDWIGGSSEIILTPTINQVLSVTQGGGAVLSATGTVDNHVSCSGFMDASITVSASGGTPPYEYSLNGSDYQESPSFTTLGEGDYTISIRDASGAIVQLDPISITEPPVLSLEAAIDEDGTVSLTPAGGTPPYQFGFNGANFQDAPVFESLANGVYEFVVLDANACVSTVDVEVAINTLVVNASVLQSVNCNDQSDGSITVQVSGGTPPYQYSLDGENFQSENQFNDLPAGDYMVTVLDAEGFTLQSSLLTIEEPEALLIELSLAANSVLIEVFNGSPPYLYSLNNGPFQNDNSFTDLPEGENLIQVMDANGCVASESVLINSVNDPFLSLQWSIFPNPTDGIFYLHFTDASPPNLQVVLYNPLSQEISTKEYHPINNRIVVDASRLPPGLYLLQIRGEGKTLSKRVLIQR